MFYTIRKRYFTKKHQSVFSIFTGCLIRSAKEKSPTTSQGLKLTTCDLSRIEYIATVEMY
jgi:hypothetical protein